MCFYRLSIEDCLSAMRIFSVILGQPLYITSEQVDKNGYGIIENFLTEEETEEVKNAGDDFILQSMKIRNKALFMATDDDKQPQVKPSTGAK